ncbi:hypothetical protein DXG03_009314 [Asterophora parasitica]|uniref:Uncharacterized protein n=1 Tax=Asterophora parasitica TaxID=117018 RepID=A0A9P7KAZ9_9AGAR|nr:hypothetical protein DXG03_009314 [Asterophora parasitica]
MPPLKPTDFGLFVVQLLAKSTRESTGLDQHVLRQALGLSSSFLVTDATMNDGGAHTWLVGFSRLVDVVVALHARSELELETVNAAARACSDCWGASGSWQNLAHCRDGVRTVAHRLKKLLDPNGRTYRGQPVYSPTA